jgi:hypothetical protein
MAKSVLHVLTFSYHPPYWITTQLNGVRFFSPTGGGLVSRPYKKDIMLSNN